MLTKIPTQTDWLGLYEAGMAAFIFGMLLLTFGILFLEWSELAKSVKSIFKLFIKPKKSQ
ncbi:hypothetical protein WAF17_16690 [Bernardetia sp. ABR2-2B]|uniref:hypothetical protein n=1 Tax=Bernardetia sp. ABR2-2B TaxID=3127472 RepID=UPI0030CDFC86